MKSIFDLTFYQSYINSPCHSSILLQALRMAYNRRLSTTKRRNLHLLSRTFPRRYSDLNIETSIIVLPDEPDFPDGCYQHVDYAIFLFAG